MQIHVGTHIMFQGKAREAIAFYQRVFPDFVIKDLIDPLSGETESLTASYRADISFAGHRLVIIDSPPVHDFDLTPSASLLVDFVDRATLDLTFEKLAQGGEVCMPLGDYGFSRRFGWVSDRFGLSWQLNLPS